MKTIRNSLLYAFWTPIIITLIIIILGETDIIPNGMLNTYQQAEFIITCTMEILTIILIPLALKLFTFKAISKQLHSNLSLTHLKRWGLLRIGMLTMPMLINIVCYYLFVSAAFGYLAIILFLSLFFVYPSLSRCYNETDNSNS